MQVVWRFPALLLAFILPSTALFSQTTQPISPATGNLITLTVTVDSKDGKAVEGLTAADFKLLDNKSAQPIVSFRALTGQQAPTEVILVVDAVNLPYTRLTYTRKEIENYLSANGGKLSQPTALAVLQDSGLQIQPQFTTDGNALQKALDSYNIALPNMSRSAGFNGASDRFENGLNAIQMLVAREAQRPGRKLILWVSPGWPLLRGSEANMSTAQQHFLFGNIVMLSTEMRSGQITVDAVNPIGASEDIGGVSAYENFVKGVRDAHQAEVGDLALQVLAVQSGGLVLNGSNDIGAMVGRCFIETEEGYELTFAPAPGEHDNEYHQIQLEVAKHGLTVHTDNGYYARPNYPTTDEQKH